MKKWNILCLLLLLLAMLTACGQTKEAEQETKVNPGAPEVEQETKTNPEAPEVLPDETAVNCDIPAEPEEDSAEKTYMELIERCRDLVTNPSDYEDLYVEGEYGVIETARVLGEDALYEMGYMIEDLSGDGVPELVVGELSGPINALYTLVDGEPRLVFEGWYRSSYVYMGNGHFCYYGSNSAAETGQGVYYLTQDGTMLECESFLFTGINSDGDSEVYSNETGIWDPEESIKSDMTVEEFWELDPAGETLPLMPFSGEVSRKDATSQYPVSVQYLTETGNGDCEWVTLYDGPDACCILITTESTISDLNLWNLFVEDVEEDGTLICSPTLAGDDCHWDTVTPDTSIAVQLIFPGDLPSYGISYRDQQGVQYRFVLEVSGYDGSLLMREVDPDESKFVLQAEG